jgi:hypothetical protein
MTTVIPQSEENFLNNLVEAQTNAAKLDRNVRKQRQLELWQSFGTIGYDSYMSWVLSDRSVEGFEITG